MDKTLSRKAADIDRILSKADSLQATFDGSTGSESYANLLAAIQAGKRVSVFYNDMEHHYQGRKNDTLVFSNTLNSTMSIIEVSATAWTAEEKYLATSSNMGVDTTTGELYIEI